MFFLKPSPICDNLLHSLHNGVRIFIDGWILIPIVVLWRIFRCLGIIHCTGTAIPRDCYITPVPELVVVLKHFVAGNNVLILLRHWRVCTDSRILCP